MYVKALIRAFGQVSDPASLKVLFGSVASAIGLAIVAGGGVYWALTQMSMQTWEWLDSFGDAIGGLLAGLIILFLFPGIVVVVSSLFLETICRSVDRRWYDSLPTAREQPLAESIQGAIMFGMKALGLNLLILLFIWTGPIYLLLYLAVNAHLLSSEYFELVAVRRMELKQAKGFAKGNRLKIWLAGLPIAGAIAVPVLNLLVPILATAYMSHIFHALNPPIDNALEDETPTPPELP